jgi:radical SAM protein
MDVNGFEPEDLNHSPFVVFYETTRACDLACQHCRACAQPRRHPKELTLQDASVLFDQLTEFPKKPLLVFTGGDPFKRDDIFELTHSAVAAGLSVAMTPSATPLVTKKSLHRLREAGVKRLAVSLDGTDAKTHDEFRGIEGTYDRTLEIIAGAREAGFAIQINTTLTTLNFDQLDDLADFLAGQGIVLWSVFFLVNVGRSRALQRILPDQYEAAFEKLWNYAQKYPYGVKTTEAHHYRRFVLSQHGNPQQSPLDTARGRIQRAPLGVRDGNGVMFVSHTGKIYPSGFMPITCGSFPHDSVVDVYQNDDMFLRLRDTGALKGKCGVCRFREVCGGSRARAYSVFGDPLAPEPDCSYIPSDWN